MSHIGTFGSFGQARLAIYAAQLGLSVTGNNISNVNTPGYTRQRLEQVSFKTGGSDRYQSPTDIRVGNGVLPTSVSQLRDPYLDIRYRNENSSVGAMDTKLNGLDQIAAILDEVGKGGEKPEGEEFGIIAYQLGIIYKALGGLTDQTGQQEYDVQVRSNSESLCQMFKSYATQLERLYEDTVRSYNQNVTEVNKLLTNIRDLSASIRECDIHGDKALELRDQRNNLIDELSTYMKIDVTYTTESIGAGKEVEKLVINLANTNPDKSVHSDESVLVDGRYCTQLITKEPILNTLEDFPYEKQGGGYTADPEKAVMVPKPNPDFKENEAQTGTNLPYLNAEDKPVEKAEDAVQVPKERTDSTSFQYLKEGGGFTNKLEEAATELRKNPNYDPNYKDPHDPNHKSYEYLDEDGNPTNNSNVLVLNTGADKDEKPYIDQNGNATAQKPAMRVPKENPDYKPYMQEDGTPTAELEDAEMVDLPNFGLKLAELKDVNDKVLETVVKMEERILKEGETYSKEAVSVLLPDGTTKITTYRAVQQWTLKKNEGVYDENADFKTDFPDATGGPDPTNPAHAKYFKYVMLTKDKDGNEVKSLTNNYKEAAREVTTAYYATDYIRTPSTVVELDDNDLYGKLQSQRELLTEKGEFSDLDTIANIDENAATKRGIQYYQNVLDLLARQFATSLNEANQGYLWDENGNYVTPTTTKDGKAGTEPITVTYTEGGDTKTYTLNTKDEWKDIPQAARDEMEKQAQTVLKDPDVKLQSVEDYLKLGKLDKDGKPVVDKDGKAVPNGIFKGGVLFSNNGDTDDTTNITAANISISSSWSKGPLIVNSFKCPSGLAEPGSTDSSNIAVIQSIFNRRMEYYPKTFEPNAQEKAMFTGTFEEMWIQIGTTLGDDQKVTGTLLDNYYQKSVELDSNRANVSSVDFNDEAMNLMQYSKSYNAACRLMTTLDSVLDKLINGTGMTT